MKTPRPLPSSLQAGVFSRRRAESLGVPPKRLRARDIERVGHGLYVWVGNREQDTYDRAGWIVKTAPDRHLEFLETIQSEYPHSWFSHSTAAQIYGLDLPPWLSVHSAIHMSRRWSSTSPRRTTNLRSHTVVTQPNEVTCFNGLRVSRPARVFFDLMGALPEKELVALGDQLVRHPYPELEDRDHPWETPTALHGLIDSHRKTRGIVKGRRAARRIRVGADSRPETLLRLAILEAGLPEPQLQVRPTSGSSYSGDIGYEELKIVLHYDGGGHFTAAQQASDQRRNHAFECAGWTVISVNSVDLQEGFVRIVAQLRDTIRTRLHLQSHLSPPFGPF